jgi:hypothetical protein
MSSDRDDSWLTPKRESQEGDSWLKLAARSQKRPYPTSRYRHYTPDDSQVLLADAIRDNDLQEAHLLLMQEVRLVFKQFETVSHCRSLDMLKLLAHFGFPFQEYGAPLMM